jgi:competence protein ComGC
MKKIMRFFGKILGAIVLVYFLWVIFVVSYKLITVDLPEIRENNSKLQTGREGNY